MNRKFIFQIHRVGRRESGILFEEIKKELGEFLTKESDDKDVADGIFEFLSTISESFQEEFD